MRGLMVGLLLIAALGAGCAPKELTKNDKGITIQYAPAFTDQAHQQAEEHCQRLGKSAVLNTNMHYGPRFTTSWRCE